MAVRGPVGVSFGTKWCVLRSRLADCFVRATRMVSDARHYCVLVYLVCVDMLILVTESYVELSG